MQSIKVTDIDIFKTYGSGRRTLIQRLKEPSTIFLKNGNTFRAHPSLHYLGKELFEMMSASNEDELRTYLETFDQKLDEYGKQYYEWLKDGGKNKEDQEKIRKAETISELINPSTLSENLELLPMLVEKNKKDDETILLVFTVYAFHALEDILNAQITLLQRQEFNGIVLRYLVRASMILGILKAHIQIIIKYLQDVENGTKGGEKTKYSEINPEIEKYFTDPQSANRFPEGEQQFKKHLLEKVKCIHGTEIESGEIKDESLRKTINRRFNQIKIKKQQSQKN